MNDCDLLRTIFYVIGSLFGILTILTFAAFLAIPFKREGK